MNIFEPKVNCKIQLTMHIISIGTKKFLLRLLINEIKNLKEKIMVFYGVDFENVETSWFKYSFLILFNN